MARCGTLRYRSRTGLVDAVVTDPVPEPLTGTNPSTSSWLAIRFES
jgi:hypothetical protein